MSCPPGTVLNPYTYRCIRASGRRARNLVRAGNIPEYAAPPAYAGGMAAFFQPPQPPRPQPLPVRLRQTVSRPRRPAVGAGAFGDIIRLERGAAPAAIMAPHTCPPGTVTNPHTGRCIKVTGRTYKQLHKGPASAAPARVLTPPRPAIALPPREVARRIMTEGPPVAPAGIPVVAPVADRNATLQWIASNCANATDPVTRTTFATQPVVEDIVRLHDNTCAAAPGLHKHVAAEHKAGRVAAIPGNRHGTPMTLEDFTALRAAMRRRDPAYKVPSRHHEPPPPTWQLYVASDRRSGPDFASVMYVDVTKVRQTAYGVEYPPEAVRVDMGFIPAATPLGALCSAQTIVDLLDRLAKANRLLTPVAGGWRPVAGFPFSRDHWRTDTTNRVNRLCRDLAKALAHPA